MLLYVLIVVLFSFGVESSTLSTPAQNQLIQTNQFSCAGKTFGFYPNPNGCDSYFICAGQIASEVRCANGLLYNDQTKFCDWPTNVNCPATTQSSTSSTVQPGVQANTPSNTQMNTNSQTKLLAFTNAPLPTTASPTQNSNLLTQLLVFTQSPTKLLVFTNAPAITTTPVQSTTQAPTNGPTKLLVFTPGPAQTTAPVSTNPPTKLLVFTQRPSNTNIPVNTNAPTQLLMFTNQPTQAQNHASSNIPVATTTAPYVESFCRGKLDGLFRDPQDCGYFYQCSYGLTYHEPCSPGTVFNEQSSACDYPFTVPACFNYQYQG